MAKLRVWWVPQIPCPAFRVETSSVEESMKVMNILADYDLHQYNNNIKPDYANMGGIEIFDEADQDWYDFDPEFDEVD